MEHPPHNLAEKVNIPGLSSIEAAARKAQGFVNHMPKGREGSVLSIIGKNLFTLFNLLNAALAFLLWLVGSYRNMLFLGVVVSNTAIGIVQELRAKHMHDRLQLLAEGKITAIRDGMETAIAFSELVLDDVVQLSRGDQVPGDAHILDGACEADESLLTGESEPMAKARGDGLLSGSFITEGAVTARLTAVGADSYAGRLQMAARKVKHARSELMENMRKIIRYVSVVIVPMGLLLFWRQIAAHDMDMESIVTKTVAAMVGMIPEGLILLTSVALTMGVIRLGKRQAMVNALYGIESLARVDVVCMDKTGTLTNGEMRLEEVLPLANVTEGELTACVRAILSTQKDASPTRDALWEGVGGRVSRFQIPVSRIPLSSDDGSSSDDTNEG